MEVWFARGMAAMSALFTVLPVHADAREITVYFGEPALEIEIVDLRRPPQRCPGPVTIERRFGGRRESLTMPLLDCERRPREEARRALSILARPRAMAEPPTSADMARWREADGDPELLADGVRLVHPELLDRLQRIADAFEGHAIELMSGYRPTAAAHSRHHHARALDLTVVGVPREELRDLAMTFAETGVGWYPNSTFVHVDVREESAYWIDVSSPGERPRYVQEEPSDEPPPSAAELTEIRREVERALRGLEVPAP